MTALDLVRRNWETFYRFDTGVRVNLVPRYILIATLSIVLAIFHRGLLVEFASLSVSVLSIFAGFSFAVIFFIVEEKGRSGPSNSTEVEDDLEGEIIDEKLEKLKSELFFNLSYFNLVSIIAVCLLLMHSVSITNVVGSLLGPGAAFWYKAIFLTLGRFFAFLLVIE